VTLTVYRIIEMRWQEGAFSGEGARQYPGRWNSRGAAMVYAASSRALAMLEILATLPPECIMALGDALPHDWRATPAPESTRAIGDDWLGQRASLALAVPSTLVPEEMNYLINPNHPEFERIVIGEAQRLDVDKRLIKTR
jgi:RES domain-containing protein